MQPLYAAIGIITNEKKIVLMGLNPNETELQIQMPQRALENGIDEYRIYNIMVNSWIEEFQWWLSNFDVLAPESKDIARSVLQQISSMRE